MRTIPSGAKGSFSLIITPEHLANRFKDAMLPPVLATPVMIMVMENAALNAMKPYLDASESALGTRVDVRHLAATQPAGASRAKPKSPRSTGGASRSRSGQRTEPRSSASAHMSGWSSISSSFLSG